MLTFKPLAPLRLLLVICILFTGVTQSDAQVEHLASLNHGLPIFPSSYKFQNGTEIVLVRNNWRYDFWKITGATGSAVLIDSTAHFIWNSQIVKNESGLFYLTREEVPNTNTTPYFINHIDTNGVRHVSQINGSYTPKLVAVQNNEVMYLINKELFKNTTALNSQTLVSTFVDPIAATFVANDSLIVVTQGTNNYRLYNCTVSTGAEWRLSLPGIPSLVGQKSNEFFFLINESTSHHALWKSNLTAGGTSRYIDSTFVANIQFEGNTFILQERDERNYWTGDYAHPENRTKMPFAAGLDPGETYIDFDTKPTKNLFRLLSLRHGIELGKFENDSIRLAGDLFKGIGTGWIGRQADVNLMHTWPYAMSASGTDSLYTIMSNGNDSLSYLYLFDGADFQSYFPVDRPEELIWLRIYGNYAYWLRSSENGSAFQRRSLITGIQLQPLVSEQPDSALVWTNYLGYSRKNFVFWGSDFNPDYNVGCKLMPDGGTVTCFMLRYFRDNFVFTPDGYYDDSLHAGIIFSKYDAYGKVSWTRSLGGQDNFMLESPHFTIDSEGNILVVAATFHKAYFGADSLSLDRGANFLAKLNGLTGEIMWYKLLNQSYYTDKIRFEGIALDANNRIYLPLYFTGFSCTISGKTVEATASPSNAIARFSSNGDLELLKATPTPWTDYGGATKVFAYNTKTAEIVSAQTQAAYNSSSSCGSTDWDYFTQVIDADGNVKKQKSFVSSEIGSLATATIAGGNVIGFGYFSGNLDLELFSETTAVSGSCYAKEGFMYSYSPAINAFTAFKTTISEPFYPLDSKSYGGYVYVYGTDENHELLVIRMTAQGEETGYLRLGQYADAFHFEDDQFFDVNADYLVFSGNLFQSNPAFNVSPPYGFCPYKTVLKTRNAGWKTDRKWFESEQMYAFADSDEDVAAFPNPFSDHITVAFHNIGFAYKQYELFDLQGQRVAAGELSEEVLQVLPVGALTSGSYLLRFSADQQQKTLKLIKL
jgi:hypothetical protein